MQFGVIGAGRIGKIHGGNIARRARLLGDLRRRRGRRCGESLAGRRARTSARSDEISAAKEVDAVAICSPTDAHADLIERSARAGKAIFCEKPIDLSTDRSARGLDVVRAHKATLMIGFNRRFDPNFATVRRRVAEGAIGTSKSSPSPRAIPDRLHSPTSTDPAVYFAT